MASNTTGGSWFLRQGSTVNPNILAGGAQEYLKKKPDRDLCGGASYASFYSFNVNCTLNQPEYNEFIDALWLHEGVGSRGLDDDNPNGHWARALFATNLSIGDPYLAMERVVGTDLEAFKDAVRDEVEEVDQFIVGFIDVNHVVVRDNYDCGFLWLYDYQSQTYDYLHFGDVLASQVPTPKPCP